jgi:hypothetical protein
MIKGLGDPIWRPLELVFRGERAGLADLQGLMLAFCWRRECAAGFILVW